MLIATDVSLHSLCVGAGVGGGGGADASFGAGPAEPQHGASSSPVAAVPLVVERPSVMDPLDDPDADAMEEDSDVGLHDPWDEPMDVSFEESFVDGGAGAEAGAEAWVVFGVMRSARFVECMFCCS